MENVLEYYYNLKNVIVENRGDYYLVSSDNNKYIFQEFNYDLDELKKIVETLNDTNILYHLIVYTKDNEIIVKFKEKDYILLKIRLFDDKNISLFDFQGIKVEGKSSWSELWSKRIDYYELQVNEVIKNDSLKYAIQYYIGMTENAIAFLNDLDDNFDNSKLFYTICHRMIDVPLNSLTFYNPLNLMIDLGVRDIAEYIKMCFFNEILTNFELLDLINNINFDNVNANYFFARLLYPSYFFYLYDKFIEDGEIDDRIFLIIKKSSEFELLVKSIYNRLSIKNEILYNGWLIKSQH